MLRFVQVAGLALLLTVCLVVSAKAGEEKMRMGYKWSVDAAYPKFGAKKVDDVISEWLEAHIAKRVDEVKDFADTEDPKGSWEMGVDYSVTRPSEGVVSVAFNTYTYPRGAAHPSSRIDVLNLSLADGKALRLEDLFSNPGKAMEIFAAKAPGLISDQFRKMEPKQFPDGLADEDWFKEGFEPKPENYAALGLEPEGVRVFFQQYQVLPYVFGMPDILIPLSALEEAGPNVAVWPGK